MATKYCSMCDRPVEAKRKIGVGTLILCLVTGGFWIPVIFFYKKRCPICLGTEFTDVQAAKAEHTKAQKAVKVAEKTKEINEETKKIKTEAAS